MIFSEVFKNLEYAQKRELTSAEKLQFLGPKMIHESNRIGLKDVILQSMIHDWNYDQTVSLLIKVNSGLGETDQTVQSIIVEVIIIVIIMLPIQSPTLHLHLHLLQN